MAPKIYYFPNTELMIFIRNTNKLTVLCLYNFFFFNGFIALYYTRINGSQKFRTINVEFILSKKRKKKLQLPVSQLDVKYYSTHFPLKIIVLLRNGSFNCADRSKYIYADEFNVYLSYPCRIALKKTYELAR